MQAGPPCRYVVERCPGGGDRVEVIDLERKPLRRVVARTSWRDAHMIADALTLAPAQIKRMQDFLCERGLYQEYIYWLDQMAIVYGTEGGEQSEGLLGE